MNQRPKKSVITDKYDKRQLNPTDQFSRPCIRSA